jgi:phospholipase C
MSAPKFDHLVVVMMENRSFDHMLGWLYSEADPPPRGQSFNSAVQNGPDLAPVQGPVQSWCGVQNDPAHDFISVQWQLFGSADQMSSKTVLPGIPTPPVASMTGFAKNYALWYPSDTTGAAEIVSVFPTYDGGDTPGLSILPALARSFAVSDCWFASVPTQTLPNRSFCNAGTSNGFISNSQDWTTQNTNKTIFTALGGRPFSINSWRVYHDKLDEKVPGHSLTFLIHWPELRSFDDPTLGYRRSIEDFETDAANCNLPAYSFIEPRVAGYDTTRPLNDEHPKQDIRFGENFINRIYSAVVNSELWEKTLLVITYDEHGGIYDHVSPPHGVPAPPQAPRPLDSPSQELLPVLPPFDFTRLGVRVPAVIVSPYIPAGTVYHPPTGWVDHTAIIKTLTSRWGLDHLTARDKAAPDLSELLTLEEPRRNDFPRLVPWALPLVPPPELLPANDLQHDFIRLVARVHGLPPPTPPRTVADVMAFLRSVPE